jgi:CheY-like chemotaxis protein
MKTRHHIVFVDDDEAELTTFRRLYAGDRFEVTTVCAPFPRSALPAIERALGQDMPDLFVLDLSFQLRATSRRDSRAIPRRRPERISAVS